MAKDGVKAVKKGEPCDDKERVSKRSRMARIPSAAAVAADLEQEQVLEFGELPKRMRSDYIMTEQEKQCRRVLVHSWVAFNQVKKQSEDRAARLGKASCILDWARRPRDNQNIRPSGNTNSLQ